MNKRLVLIGFIVVALLLWLGRHTVLDLITRAGGFDLLPQDEVVTELPGIEIPRLPNFKPGPSSWRQTTGLICGCEYRAYSSPFAVRQIEIPPTPFPHFAVIPKSIEQQAASPPLTYSSFGMDDSFTFWGTRPYEQVWRGSDGRIFLKPKSSIWGMPEPNTSDDPQLIGTNEYSITDGNIHYGPYIYKPNQAQFGSRSA